MGAGVMWSLWATITTMQCSEHQELPNLCELQKLSSLQMESNLILNINKPSFESIGDY